MNHQILKMGLGFQVPSEIDTFVKHEILDEFGRTYPKWIQECYLHRISENADGQA